MRASGSVDSARALGHHDHLCWVYDDHEDFVAAMTDFLAMGLRVAAEATPLVRTAGQRSTFARYEHLIDRYMVSRPFSALCAYHREELDDDAIAGIACLHPLGRAGAAPFQVFASECADLGLAGEVDVASVDLFRRTLDDVMPDGHQGELTVDARHLEFVDHRGLGVLDDEACRHRATIVLRTPLATSQRLVELLDLAAVRVESSR